MTFDFLKRFFTSVAPAAPRRGLNIVIVGGGLGGALAARVLRTHHNVTILEQTPHAVEVGAALLLGPTTMQYLDSLGFDRSRVGGIGMDFVRMLTNTEALVFEHALNYEKDYGDKWVSNGRPELRNEFLRLATAPSAELGLDGDPAKVVFGAQVVDIDTEKGKVTLKNGDIYEADLIIGADGINSVVRPFVVDEPGTVEPPKPSGVSLFRLIVPAKEAMEINPHFATPSHPFLGIMADPEMLGQAFVFYPFRDFTVFNIALLVPDSMLVDQMIRSTNELRSTEEVLACFQKFPESMKATIRLATEIRLWKLRHQEPLPSYVKGRTVLIGDAAHSMTSNQSQGAIQAIEDVEGLVLLNDNTVTRDNVHAVLEQWERVRRPRASIVQKLSLKAATDGDKTNVHKHSRFYWTYPGIVKSLERLDAGETITYG